MDEVEVQMECKIKVWKEICEWCLCQLALALFLISCLISLNYHFFFSLYNIVYSEKEDVANHGLIDLGLVQTIEQSLDGLRGKKG